MQKYRHVLSIFEISLENSKLLSKYVAFLFFGIAVPPLVSCSSPFSTAFNTTASPTSTAIAAAALCLDCGEIRVGLIEPIDQARFNEPMIGEREHIIYSNAQTAIFRINKIARCSDNIPASATRDHGFSFADSSNDGAYHLYDDKNTALGSTNTYTKSATSKSNEYRATAKSQHNRNNSAVKSSSTTPLPLSSTIATSQPLPLSVDIAYKFTHRGVGVQFDSTSMLTRCSLWVRYALHNTAEQSPADTAIEQQNRSTQDKIGSTLQSTNADRSSSAPPSLLNPPNTVIYSGEIYENDGFHNPNSLYGYINSQKSTEEMLAVKAFRRMELDIINFLLKKSEQSQRSNN